DHTAGDMFWWLTHGLRNAMPGFAAALSEDDRWDVINFIRALSAGEAARRLTDVDEPEQKRLIAPDFSFATRPAQASLQDSRGRPAPLVLFPPPGSRPRLVQLADAYGELRSFNATLIAVPMDSDQAILSRIGATPRILFPVVTDGAADIVTTYALFRRTLAPAGALPDPPHPPHIAF